MREFRLAFRTLSKAPGFLLLAISTLALGIAAATVLFSVTESVLWRPLPFAHAERLVVVWERNLKRAGGGGSASVPNFADWRSRVRSLDGLAAMSWGDSRNLSSQGSGERVRVRRISAGFLETLGIQPALGRTFRPDEEHAVASQPVILSYSLWQSRFGGSPEVLGQSVKLDGDAGTVVGVLPATFHLEFVGDSAAVFVPIATDAAELRRDARNLVVIGRLKPGVTLRQAGAEMEGIAASLAGDYPQSNGGWNATVDNLRWAFTQAYRRDLFLYLGFAGFVLLIACANVAGLLLVRSVGRQKEFALRTALGASPRDLWSQALAETAWIAAPGGILGSLLAAWGVPAIRALLPASELLRSREISMDFTALALVLGISLVTAFAFALAPVALASKLNLENALRDGGKSVAAHPRVSRRIDGLIAAEITMAFLLLFGAGLFLSSHARLHEVSLGFDPHAVLTMRVSTGLRPRTDLSELRTYQRRVLQKAESEAGVRSAALASDLPLLSASSVYLARTDRPHPSQGEAPDSLARAVSPAYFGVMGIPLLQGRAFTDADSESAPRVAIVNENLARRIFGAESPVGRQLEILPGGSPSVPPGTVQIVGLAPNTRETGLNEIEFNDIYCPLSQNPTRAFYVAVKTSVNSDTEIASLRHDLGALVPEGSVYDVATMDARIDDSLAGARFNLALVSFFAGLAVMLAAVGIYGAISFSAAQRTREIGLRMALGAGRRAIVIMTLMRTGRLALTGAGCGLGLALILGSVVKESLYLVPRQHAGILYGVGIHDPVSLAGAMAVMLGLAALAGLAPATRASRIEPLAALRHEP
jgi:putative ABC transport system permease protein